MKHSIDYKNIEIPIFPKMVVARFSYVCNAECPNCPFTPANSDLRKQNNNYMSSELFKNIVDQIKKDGDESTILRITGGGEPMMHPKALELFEYAKLNKINMGLITNGSMFNKDAIKRIIDMGIEMIEFSVDAGDKETYDVVRKGLDFDKLIENIKNIVSYRDKQNPNIKIIASIIDQKGVDVEKAIKFWETKVDFIQVRKYLTWNVSDTEKSGDETVFLNINNDPCPQPFERIHIDSFGDVMFCSNDTMGMKNSMGNVFKDSIKDMWNGDLVNHYRKIHLNGDACNDKLCANCENWAYKSWTYHYWKIRDELNVR